MSQSDGKVGGGEGGIGWGTALKAVSDTIQSVTSEYSNICLDYSPWIRDFGDQSNVTGE